MRGKSWRGDVCRRTLEVDLNEIYLQRRFDLGALWRERLTPLVFRRHLLSEGWWRQTPQIVAARAVCHTNHRKGKVGHQPPKG